MKMQTVLTGNTKEMHMHKAPCDEDICVFASIYGIIN